MKIKDKGFYVLIFFLVVFFCFFSLYLIRSISQMPNHQELNIASIECHNSAFFSLSANNISIDMINAENIKCFEERGYIEVELTGTYRINESDKSIFFLNIRGGMAASGQDGVNEVCLIIDGKKVISKMERGRDMISSLPSGCLWKKKLP